MYDKNQIILIIVSVIKITAVPPNASKRPQLFLERKAALDGSRRGDESQSAPHLPGPQLQKAYRLSALQEAAQRTHQTGHTVQGYRNLSFDFGGLTRWGSDCKYNCHKKCSEFVPKDCPGNTTSNQYFLGTTDDGQSCVKPIKLTQKEIPAFFYPIFWFSYVDFSENISLNQPNFVFVLVNLG